MLFDIGNIRKLITFFKDRFNYYAIYQFTNFYFDDI